VTQKYKSQDKKMSSLANKIAGGLEKSDVPVAVSAIVLGNSIGYPRRVVEQDGETHDGEHSNFDEAYDFACKLLGTDEVEVEQDEKYVWFTK
jgi:hypothetical protein